MNDKNKLIHDIAYYLYHKRRLTTICIQSEKFQNCQIEKGKRYEILVVDYRPDERYIFMRKYDDTAEKLFNNHSG